jgi:hypothetical protein
MHRLAVQRRRGALWVTALCTIVLTLAGVPSNAEALSGDPSSDFPEQIANVCGAAPQSVECTQAGIAELDDARAWEGEGPYRLPRDFLALSGAHQLVVLTDLDREEHGLRTVPGTTVALDRAALVGARTDADPVLRNPDLSWASNWAGDFPAAVWAYLTWMYDDGFGGPNIDCTAPGTSGCWDHRHDILAHFPPGGTLEMGAADLADNSYTMVIAQSLPAAPVHYAFHSPTS